MKRVYFVRHGETQGNIDRCDYGPDMQLTEAGQMQAAKIAKRAQGLDFEVLISSDLKRAVDTAEVIRSAVDCNMETSELFREYQIPASLRGIKYDEPALKTYVQAREENFDNPDWHHEDGAENMTELRKRVQKAACFLENREENSIMVVTHSFFLRSFTVHALLGDVLTSENWHNIFRRLEASNTGLTVLLFDEGKWRLLTWNDHAHFAE